jgi:hypothetical protein
MKAIYQNKLNDFVTNLLDAGVEKHIDMHLLGFYFWPEQINELIKLQIATQKEKQETDDMSREIALDAIVDDINTELPFCYDVRQLSEMECSRATPEQQHYF